MAACSFSLRSSDWNLSDAYGRRPLLLLSVFGLAVDFLFTALAPTLFLLFVGRVAAGICGASYTIANAYLADITKPEERARVFGLMGAAFGSVSSSARPSGDCLASSAHVCPSSWLRRSPA